MSKEELCAVDSTSISTYGFHLVDICWGHNKEHLPLKQTLEVSFEVDADAVRKATLMSGFFASKTLGLDLNPMEAKSNYGMSRRRPS